jgi:hypothetical protein
VELLPDQLSEPARTKPPQRHREQVSTGNRTGIECTRCSPTVGIEQPVRRRSGHGDRHALDLRRAVRNLLDNDPPPRWRRNHGHPRRRRVRLTPTGPRASADFRDHAFDPFTRADPARALGSGHAGLGLAITRALAAQHGGTAWLGDGPGGIVHLWLPHKEGQ